MNSDRSAGIEIEDMLVVFIILFEEFASHSEIFAPILTRQIRCQTECPQTQEKSRTWGGNASYWEQKSIVPCYNVTLRIMEWKHM